MTGTTVREILAGGCGHDGATGPVVCGLTRQECFCCLPCMRDCIKENLESAGLSSDHIDHIACLNTDRAVQP